jgi:hypothetical protein
LIVQHEVLIRLLVGGVIGRYEEPARKPARAHRKAAATPLPAGRRRPGSKK